MEGRQRNSERIGRNDRRSPIFAISRQPIGSSSPPHQCHTSITGMSVEDGWRDGRSSGQLSGVGHGMPGTD